MNPSGMQINTRSSKKKKKSKIVTNETKQKAGISLKYTSTQHSMKQRWTHRRHCIKHNPWLKINWKNKLKKAETSEVSGDRWDQWSHGTGMSVRGRWGVENWLRKEEVVAHGDTEENKMNIRSYQKNNGTEVKAHFVVRMSQVQNSWLKRWGNHPHFPHFGPILGPWARLKTPTAAPTDTLHGSPLLHTDGSGGLVVCACVRKAIRHKTMSKPLCNCVHCGDPSRSNQLKEEWGKKNKF